MSTGTPLRVQQQVLDLLLYIHNTPGSVAAAAAGHSFLKISINFVIEVAELLWG
jgi:hypothetical protein